MATLANAYVQILPSAKGMKDNLSKVLDNEMPSGQSQGERLGSGIVSGVKKMIAAAGIGAMLKNAMSEGAALEQSVGGVETLFKDSADIVIANAQNAYKTAGLSANEYMETVTSFSATLLQGLGGDTTKAAAIANKAVIAMSDNANKFGTNMQSIMNAYQGFAKQNYTMLDNLKLGYGGTQEEMARLINDSGVLGNAIEVTADTVKEVPFDKVIAAIGVIQDNLGVTGTTAKEAASTFSGSMASMKASAKNLLGALASGENVEEATGKFVGTAETFLRDNFLPMLSRIINSAGHLIGEALKNLPSFIWEVIKGLDFSAATGLLAAVFGVKFLKDLKGYLSNKASDHWSKIHDTVSDKLGEGAESAGRSIGSKVCTAIQAFVVGYQIGTWIYNQAKPYIDKISDEIYNITHADEKVTSDNATIEMQNKERVARFKEQGAFWLRSADADNQRVIDQAADMLGLAKQFNKKIEDVYSDYVSFEFQSYQAAEAYYNKIAEKKKYTVTLPAGAPKLSSGTVVKANQKEFAAILGDNDWEPEIVSPISTIKQAVRETISEQAARPAANGSSGVITLRLADNAGRIIAEGTVNDIDQLQGQTVELTDRRLA